MNLLLLLAAFLIYLVIQSMAINGIHISAYGKTETLPNGTTADSEMILYPLYRFLNQSTQKKVYFTLAILKERTTSFPAIAGGVIQWVGDGPQFTLLPTPGQTINLAALIAWANAYLQANVEYDEFTRTVSIYQYDTVYKFSKYIRKPLLTCVICMASFWSIILFLIPVILLFGWNIKIIPIWIVDMLCLSYLNFIFYKPRI